MEQLGINLPGLIAQILNFIILYLILKSLVWPRVIAMLDARSERIKESMDRASDLQKQAVETQQEVENQLAAARKEGQEIVARSIQAADRIRADAEVEARKAANDISERAKAEIALERDRAIADLRREFADITISAAERVINQSLDKDRHSALIEEALAESSTFGKGA